ncbi:MAG: hypothetical protein SGJ10_00980 [Bacteroidota bacterium]|nr:hypothetical protein [Bacteroidota bacterium]
MKQFIAIVNKYFTFIYFTVWIICVIVAFSSCKNRPTKSNLCITGKISESTTGNKIVGADIYIMATEHDGTAPLHYPVAEIQSKANGCFSIETAAVEDIDYNLEVREKGYQHYASAGLQFNSRVQNFVDIKLIKNKK